MEQPRQRLAAGTTGMNHLPLPDVDAVESVVNTGNTDG